MSALGAHPDPLVAFHGVTCDLGNGPVLDAVTVDIERGGFLGIVGPSGSGKTTMLRTILGTVTPAAGAVHRSPGLRVGYVPQVETINWNFPVTVAEVVLMARKASSFAPWPSRAERREVDDVLDRLGLGGLGGRHIRALSGGQQQRVFMARALMGEPELLLLDEPTSGVDVRTRHDLLHLLDDLHHDGLTIVLSTHDLNGVATHLPRLLCLNVGVMALGSPREGLRSDILERTYGAPLEVLEHAGMPFVVESVSHQHHVAGGHPRLDATA